MHIYQATERGEAIAQESGLDVLADKIAKADEIQEPLLFDITRQEWDFNPNILNDQDFVENEAVFAAYDYVRGHEETKTFVRGLEIDHEVDSWRYLSDNDQPTLFPSQKTVNFTHAITQDRLVVSGVVGVLLERYKTRYPLLARSRSAEYGFSNHMEASAFVGAYVVGRIMDEEHTRLFDEGPSFELEGEQTGERVTIGGTLHGDFRMSLTRTLEKDVISPASSFVEFAPKETKWIAGYHSVEPDIVAFMITDEFLRHGAPAATRLIAELKDTLPELANENGDIGFRAGPFADYGDGDTRYHLMQLRVLLENPGIVTRRIREGELYSAPYLPQSTTLFEIKPTEDGLRFQGRNKDAAEPASGIDIPRLHYSDLFKALVMQAQEGLGRTSPQQHLAVIEYASELLMNQ